MESRLRPLEPRILLDAAAITSAVADLVDNGGDDDVSNETPLTEPSSDGEGLLIEEAQEEAGPRVLVVSSLVEGSAELADAARDDVLVVEYDFFADNLDDILGSIEAALDGQQASSIAFATQGTEGMFTLLFGLTVNTSALEHVEFQAFWRQVGSYVADGGMIDILGCDVAGSTQGMALLEALDLLADRDGVDIGVAASDNLTGSSLLGGDWTLEYGGRDAASLYFASSVQEWNQVLDISTVLSNPITPETVYGGIPAEFVYSAISFVDPIVYIHEIDYGDGFWEGVPPGEPDVNAPSGGVRPVGPGAPLIGGPYEHTYSVVAVPTAETITWYFSVDGVVQTDGNGTPITTGYGVHNTSITVNPLPTLSPLSSNQPEYDPGELVTISSNISGVVDDDLDIQIDWGDGTVLVVEDWNGTLGGSADDMMTGTIGGDFLVVTGDGQIFATHAYSDPTFSTSFDVTITVIDHIGFNVQSSIPIFDPNTWTLESESTTVMVNAALSLQHFSFSSTDPNDTSEQISEEEDTTIFVTFGGDPTGNVIVLLDWDNDGSFDEAFFGVPIGVQQSYSSPIYDDDGVFSIRIGAVSGAEQVIATLDPGLTVVNVPPSVNLQGAASVNEGEVYSLQLDQWMTTPQDPLLSGTVFWGDGTSTSIDALLGVEGAIVTHTYDDGPLTPTIRVELTDNDGTFEVATQQIDVIALFSLDHFSFSADPNDTSEQILEEEAVSIFVTFGGDPTGNVIVLLDWDNDGSFDESFLGVPIGVQQIYTSPIYDDDGVFSIRLAAVSGSDSFIVNLDPGLTVVNVPPSVNLQGAASVNEGEVYSLQLDQWMTTAQDPLLSGTVFWGDGTSTSIDALLGVEGAIVTHTYDEGPLTPTIRVELTDNDGTFEVATQQIDVIALFSLDHFSFSAGDPNDTSEQISEEEAVTIFVTFGGDPAGNVIVLLDWDNDGNFDESALGVPIGVQQSYTSPIYTDDGVFSIRLGAVSGADSFIVNLDPGVTVLNVPPSVSLQGAASVNEGEVYSLQLDQWMTTAQDPLLSGTVFWGDGSSTSIDGLLGVEGATVTHTYADGFSTPTILVQLTDNDGIFDVITKQITVLDVAPGATLQGASTANEGSTYTLQISGWVTTVQDPLLSGTVFWGDGSSTALGGLLGVEGATLTHVYTDGPLTPTITLQVTDDENTFSVDSLPVSVLNVAPTAVADSYQLDVSQGQAAIQIGAKGVLTNDTDPSVLDAAILTAQLLQQPEYGSVILNADGSFSYALVDSDWEGTDGFTYRVFDGVDFSSSVFVSVVVNNPLEVVTPAPVESQPEPEPEVEQEQEEPEQEAELEPEAEPDVVEEVEQVLEEAEAEVEAVLAEAAAPQVLVTIADTFDGYFRTTEADAEEEEMHEVQQVEELDDGYFLVPLAQGQELREITFVDAEGRTVKLTITRAETIFENIWRHVDLVNRQGDLFNPDRPPSKLSAELEGLNFLLAQETQDDLYLGPDGTLRFKPEEGFVGTKQYTIDILDDNGVVVGNYTVDVEIGQRGAEPVPSPAAGGGG